VFAALGTGAITWALLATAFVIPFGMRGFRGAPRLCGNRRITSAQRRPARDLLLDPAMSKVTSYWVWGDVGSYYGMPWSNLIGWAITGLVLLAVLNRVAPRPHTGLTFAIWVYLVNVFLPLGFCLLKAL